MIISLLLLFWKSCFVAEFTRLVIGLLARHRLAKILATRKIKKGITTKYGYLTNKILGCISWHFRRRFLKTITLLKVQISTASVLF